MHVTVEYIYTILLNFILGVKKTLKQNCIKVHSYLKQLEVLTYNMDENHIDLLIDVNHHLKGVHVKVLSKLSTKEGSIARPKRDTSVIIMRRKIKRARAILHYSVIPKSKSVKR